MSGHAGLDVRLPIGGVFTVLGLILAGYGLAAGSHSPGSAQPLAVNVNLWWGLVMFLFGGALLAGARLARRAAGVRPAAETPEGRAIEERERRTGLER